MNEPIRVLQVIGKMNRGGAETMIMNLYRNIDRSKIQFDFVVHTNQKCAFDDEILSLGGKIYRMPKFKGTNFLSYYRAWNKFFKVQKGYKIIHGHIGSTAAIYLNIAKKHGLYTIAHSHSSNTVKSIKGKIYSILSYPTRNIADYFIGCSKEAGLARYGSKVVNSNNFKVLNNAIKTEDFIYNDFIRRQKRKELGLENKFVVAHIGRFAPPKNHTFLIEIFKEVRDINNNAVLILIGDGELRTNIENKVKMLGLTDSVIFTGIRSDIPEILQAIDIVIFPSIFEGLPVTIIEAQATGVPCIISDTITDEVKVTNLVTFISLEKPAEYWANVLNKSYNADRKNTYDEIVKAGYDIKTTVSWIQEFYQSRNV